MQPINHIKSIVSVFLEICCMSVRVTIKVPNGGRGVEALNLAASMRGL